jgi:endonuclease YncB( thermonuclease family)
VPFCRDGRESSIHNREWREPARRFFRAAIARTRAIGQDGRMSRLFPRLPAALAAALLAALACAQPHAGAKWKPSYPGAARVDVAQIRFDDGDSFKLGKEPIRVLGIDTPEIADSSVGIYEDQRRGPEAGDSTRAWILRAKVVEIAYDGRDIYHRRLAHIFVDGELLAERLLRHGLAYENVRHFGDNGFPDLADRVIRAADAGPKPDFEPPHQWRKKHQRKRSSDATKSGG